MKVKFRAYDPKTKSYHYWDSETQPYDNVFWQMTKDEGMEVEQWTTYNINEVDIYQGDTIAVRSPERITQTHTGDNIPNGSYTEPMEAGIKEHEYLIEFKYGGFWGDDDAEGSMPIECIVREWDASSIKLNISDWGKPDLFPWDDEENFGDLQSLYECAKCDNMEDLIKYLNVVEVYNSQGEKVAQVKKEA